MSVGIVPVASLLIGAVVGLICVAIFAVALRVISEKRPRDAIKSLTALIGTVLGGGLLDYVAFHAILATGDGLAYYLIGLAALFLPLGILVFLDWLR